MSFNLDFLEPLKYDLQKFKDNDATTSIFVNISGYYYHENFHSDILAHYFSNELVKKHFINWLNSSKKYTNQIQSQNYDSGKVLRETERIDITLLSNDGKKAIIIENKSNGACDQDKQLFRYLTSLEQKGIEVESIFYLNKNSNNAPNLSGLEKEDIQKIESRLTIGQLVGVDSFTEKVINNVILETQNIRLSALSQEIKDLFSFIVYGGTNMECLHDFEKLLSDKDNHEKFMNALNAYNNMPRYLANKYREFISSKNYPFRFWLYRPECLVVDDIKYKDKKFAIDIWFYQESIDISILDRHDNYDLVEELKKDFGDRFPFTEKGKIRYHIVLDNPYDDDSVKRKIVEVIDKFI